MWHFFWFSVRFQLQTFLQLYLTELLGLLTGLGLPKLKLSISKAFDRVWHAGLCQKLKSYGISGQIFGLISAFLSNRQLPVVLDGKSSQEYPVTSGVPQGSILGPTFPTIYWWPSWWHCAWYYFYAGFDMRNAIAHAHLCMRIKRAKKSIPCLIKKASRCAADSTSKTRFLSPTFCKIQRSYDKITCICYFIGSLVKIKLHLHFLYRKDNRLQQIKKKHEWWNNHFFDIFTYHLNLKIFKWLQLDLNPEPLSS